MSNITLEDIKTVIDDLPVNLTVWAKGVSAHNKHKAKRDIELGAQRWMAPLKSYLQLVANRMNEAGHKTQRGTVSPNYLLKVIRASEDPVLALGYLFGKGAVIALKAMWSLHTAIQTEMMRLLRLLSIYGEPTGNFMNDNYYVGFKSTSMKQKMLHCLDRLQGFKRFNKVKHKT